jgi:hypothetical protein
MDLVKIEGRSPQTCEDVEETAAARAGVRALRLEELSMIGGGQDAVSPI